jgi:DHA1 family bicyclomycin/chloramphenicol resistance-like MFS transporter
VFVLSGYLILITALIRLGTSLYLPALPMMADALTLSAQHMATTMTAYLVGFALASVLLGPLSDHWGRRVLVLGGVFAFGVGSLVCALAPGYALLIAGRVLQAAGGAAVVVSTRAISRETFSDQQMSSVLGWISVITGVVPVFAPALGGVLTQALGWQANFYLLAGASVVILLLTSGLAPETLAREQRTPFELVGTLKAYGTMLTTASFMLPTLPIMLCFAVQGAYLVASPFIFINVFGLSPAAFGFTSLALVAGLLLGRTLCMMALKRWGEFAAFMVGAALAFVGGIGSLGIVLAQWISPLSVLTASAVFCVGFGALAPIGMKAGLSAFPERIGTSSALYGTLTLGATALGSAGIGALLQRSASDVDLLCLITFAASLLTLIGSYLARRALTAGEQSPLATGR